MSKPVQVVTYSRREIEAADLTCTVPTIAVCVAYPTGRLHKVCAMGNLLGVHHVRFSDCDGEGVWSFPENKDHAEAIPMTRGQALDILDFVRKHPEAERIAVACFGGVSRSRGVAAGLCAVFGWDDTAIYAAGQPNAWCKTLIVRAGLGGPSGLPRKAPGSPATPRKATGEGIATTGAPPLPGTPAQKRALLDAIASEPVVLEEEDGL